MGEVDSRATPDDLREWYKSTNIEGERVDRALELNKRFDELKDCFKATDLELPKVQTADDINTSALDNMTLQDLNGNQVKLGDLFAKNKLTMLDIWKTDCSVCVDSMPELDSVDTHSVDWGTSLFHANEERTASLYPYRW